MTRYTLYNTIMLLALSLPCMGGRRVVNLVPGTASVAPDYFCTWNTQGYAVNYGTNEAQRSTMTEEYLLRDIPHGNWASLYELVRGDLLLVLDDSWDMPRDDNRAGSEQVGRLALDETRFPSFRGDDTARMRALQDTVKARGWKGLGLWVAAQRALSQEGGVESEDAFWQRRLGEMEAAGVRYWKVDWGRRDRDDAFRRQLSDWGHTLAPHLCVEHAMKPAYVCHSDAYRTYDVENIISLPVTIRRVCDLLPLRAEADGLGIINCEDEPYVAVGLGCAMGVMRHPFVGNLPDGTPDFVFPSAGRDLKRRADEVVRAVRWHRIATPFGVNADCQMDTVMLTDHWRYHEGESYVPHAEGELVRAVAPARVSRRMPLPEVYDSATVMPFLLCSRHPGGHVALSAIGRTLEREYVTPRVSVSIRVDEASASVGLFGHFAEVTLVYDRLPRHLRIYAQDLKGDVATDITREIRRHGNKLIVPGALIDRIGLSCAAEGDVSEPGMVLRVMH